MTIFADRRDAGRRLGAALSERVRVDAPLVLGLPRGGVPVACEVARAVDGELDVLVVRKLGAPHQPEFAVGAIASGGIRVLSEEVCRAVGVGEDDLAAIIRREAEELERREKAYRAGRPQLDVEGRNIILVDDGMATGSTMLAAAKAVRKAGAAYVAVAVPTAAPEAAADLEEEADLVLCLDTPSPYMAVGYWYSKFGQTSDEEVRELLDEFETAGQRAHR